MEVSTVMDTGRELRGGTVDHLTPVYVNPSNGTTVNASPRNGSYTMVDRSTSYNRNYSRSTSRTSLSSAKRRAAAPIAAPHASQKFTETQKETLKKFSSINYSPTHSPVYKDWLSKHPPKLGWDRWVLMILIGLVIGVLAWILKQCIQAIDKLKWTQTKEFAQEQSLLISYIWTAGLSSIFIILSSLLVTYVHPPGAGSGVPEVIAYLNGVIVHGTQSVKNLLVKFISLVLAVCSGLPAATQGPVIAMGAIVGVGMGQFKSKTFGINPKIFSRFRNPEDRRSFTTAGVAAGVAAAFNAPIGGLLFAMEDLSSFWSRSLSWQTFFCAVVAAATAKLLNSAFVGFEYNGELGLYTQNIIEPVPYNVAIFVPAVALGIIGGILGAIFTRLNNAINLGRKHIVASIKNMHAKRIIRIVEAVLMVNIMAGAAIYLPSAFECTVVPPRNITSPYAACGLSYTIGLEEYTCNDQATNTTSYYNEIATLLQSGGVGTLQKLAARNHHRYFAWDKLLFILPIYFFMTCLTAGLAIVGGTFVPLLVNGAIYGRVMGIGMLELYELWTGDRYPRDPYWQWMDPGLIALLGAGSLLGGVTRLTLAITVIIVEMSQDIDLVVPLMIANFVAKVVADMLAKPLYKYQLDMKSLPYLDPRLEVAIDGNLVNMELYKAADVMEKDVLTIQQVESVGYLARILLDTEHGGFPVVKYDHETRREYSYGLLTRNELYIILCADEVYDFSQENAVVTPNVDYEAVSVDYIVDLSAKLERLRSYSRFPQYDKIFINLNPYINQSAPKVDEQYSLLRTHTLFRTLGLRHLVVTDMYNKVVGIITRKDIMQFKVIEKIVQLENEDPFDDHNGHALLPSITVQNNDFPRNENGGFDHNLNSRRTDDTTDL